MLWKIINYWFHFFNKRYRPVQVVCFFLVLVLADCVFQGICTFHLGFQIFGYKVIHNIPLLSMDFFLVMSPLSILVLVICVFCLYFLVSLEETCLVYHSFHKINFWFCWFFSIDFLFSISLISALVFIISFLFLIWDLIC